MSIANKGVYPFSLADTGAPMTFGLGLTYREWLIGMLASNAAVFSHTSGGSIPIDEFIIQQADAIIKQLDKEKE